MQYQRLDTVIEIPSTVTPATDTMDWYEKGRAVNPPSVAGNLGPRGPLPAQPVRPTWPPQRYPDGCHMGRLLPSLVFTFNSVVSRLNESKLGAAFLRSVVLNTEVYVSFSAEINASTTESLIAAMTNLANQGVPKVTLLLSTPGGAVMNGMNVYNVLRAMPFELTTHNVGNVDSIGNAIFLAGERRYAAPHSTFMFHGVGFQSQPGHVLEEKNPPRASRRHPS